jgi:PAS domain S-box-containing protein
MFSLSMAEWKEYYDKVLSEAKSISIETESNINAGKEHFEIHLNPVFNEKRDITAVSAIAYNISKQRYLEKQLTQSNELLRQNELITLTGSWEWDIQNQTMFWTDQVFRIHDIEPANIEPGSKERIIQSLSCYFPTDQPIIIEAFQNCCEKGIPYDLEARFTSRKGREIWIRTIGNPVAENGKVLKVIGNIQDITERKEREDALKHSERKFRMLVEHAAEMMFLFDVNGKIIDVNKAAMQQTCYSRSELMNMTVFDIDQNTKSDNDYKKLWASLNDDLEKRIETMHRKKDGTEYYAEVSTCKINLGENSCIMVLAHDITKRKQKELEINENEKRFRDLLQEVKNVSVQGYAPDGKTLYWNKASEKLYGYTANEAIGKNLVDLIIPAEMKSDVEQAIHQMAKTGEPLPGSELILKRKNGSLVPVFSNHAIIQVPGKDQELFCIDIDLTEQKRAEKERQKSLNQLSGIIENLPGSLWIVDENYTYLLGNHKFENDYKKVFGKKIKSGDFILAETSEEDSKEWRDYYNRTLKGNQFVIERERKYGAMGTWSEYHFAPIRLENNRINGITVLSFDITDRKNAENILREKENMLRELNASKDKFFSIIAHDLRSPFNGIVGFSSLLLDQIKENDFEGIEKYAGIIVNSSQLALDLLNTLMEWSRLQTGRMSFRPENFVFEVVASETCAIFAEIAAKKAIEINMEFTGYNEVEADIAMVGTVLRNLISNAIKFTKSGGKIIISAKPVDKQLLVSVRDTGIGISSENIKKLFRIEETYTTKGTLNEKGTGLGLILCKEFIEKNGGQIWAESEIGKGSTFWFLLPLFSE